MTNEDVKNAAIGSIKSLIEVIAIHERKHPVHYIIMSEVTRSLYASTNLLMGSENFEIEKQTILGKRIAINNDLKIGEIKLATIMLDM